ncbi:MAG: hypothetical protein HZB53_18530 [Chloroflexi bacterium]|nr:hypothetical protein [Chloroflexota bacterium]
MPVNLPPFDEFLVAAVPLLPIVILATIFWLGPKLVRRGEQFRKENEAIALQNADQLIKLDQTSKRYGRIFLFVFGPLFFFACATRQAIAIAVVVSMFIAFTPILTGLNIIGAGIGFWPLSFRIRLVTGRASRRLGFAYIAFGLIVALSCGAIGLLALTSR